MPTPLQLWPLARFVRCALGEISTDDHLGHDPIRVRSESIADTGVYIEAPDLEIDHGIDGVLLLVPRLEAPERPDIGVVLDPEREALAEAAGETPARSKDGLPVLSEAEIDNRVKDEFPIVLAPTDDGPDLHVPSRLRERRGGVAFLEIHAKEEFPLGRIGTDKQLPKLGGVGVERAVPADRIRDIEPELQPGSNPIGQFRCAVERMVWNDPAFEIRILAPADGVIGMRLQRPLADFRNLGIVNLDLVVDAARPCVSTPR